MTDKQIVNKIREWLILNIRSMSMYDELIDDNKLLLKAIRACPVGILNFRPHGISNLSPGPS